VTITGHAEATGAIIRHEPVGERERHAAGGRRGFALVPGEATLGPGRTPSSGVASGVVLGVHLVPWARTMLSLIVESLDSRASPDAVFKVRGPARWDE
jgi:hypothetical protein